MGRTDAVQFTLEWAAEAKRLGGIVDFEPGWETRGNGTSANYEGGVVHHTAFLSSEGNPFPAKSTLKNGRPDLGGPLCNVAGPWCEDGAPRLVVIAAHPANHAGASGGKSMGPLSVTSLFNPRVFGLEIDYGGVVPMTKGQRKAATIFGRAVINVLKRNAEYVRAHAETSITGKWDPGYANGKTIDMAEFRQGITNFSATSIEEPDLDADQNNRLTSAWVNSAAAAGSAADAARLAQENVNWIIDPNHGVLKQLGDLARAVAAGRDDVDEAALASAVTASLVPAVVAALAGKGGLTEEQVRAATEAAVREVFGDAATATP